MNSAHEFAFYLSNLSSLLKSCDEKGRILLRDKALIRRITQIVKLSKNQLCIFFDEFCHVSGQIEASFEKKQVFFLCKKIKENRKIVPEITLCLGLVKRSALESIVYNATQLGVTNIQLLKTEKVQRVWGGEKEKDRLKKIAIAAAEQSKQFVFPVIFEPTSLTSFLEKDLQKNKILFDATGKPLFPVLQNLYNEKNKAAFCIAIGSEGGFSEKELQRFRDKDFEVCSLTPTILRSIEAVTVGVGVLRSCVLSRSYPSTSSGRTG